MSVTNSCCAAIHYLNPYNYFLIFSEDPKVSADTNYVSVNTGEMFKQWMNAQDM